MKTKTIGRFFVQTAYRAILFSEILLCVCGSILMIFNSKQHIYRDLQSISSQKSGNIQLNMKTVEEAVRNIVFNTELQHLLIKYEERSFSTITEARIQINEAVTNLSLFFSQADNVVVYAADGTVVGSKFEVTDGGTSPLHTWGGVAADAWENTMWMTGTGKLVNEGGRNVYTCMVATKIRARSTKGNTRVGDLLGYLIVYYSFRDVVRLMQTEQNGYQTYLADANGSILSSNQNNAIGTKDEALSGVIPGTAGPFVYNGTRMIAASTKLNILNADWRCVCMVPEMQILDDAKLLILITALLTGMIMVSMFFAVQRNARGISTVFEEMNRSIGMIESGKLDLDAFSETGIHEIDGAIQRFSHMGAALDRLMYELYEAELRKQQLLINYKEAELLNLKIQINPHFLYNTLDTINWTARMHGDEDIAEMVLALGKLFRANMDLSTADATIAQEVERVNLFMKLEQKRFGDRLRYEIHVDEVLNNEKIPAILLQPLVENAVRHGIAPYNIDGRIFVRIERERDLIVIRVGDNGGGMEPDMLKALADMWENIRNDPMRVKEDTRNVGLRNIMKRLSLLYGKRASFVIESAKGGTTITIGYPPAL